jgi:broad specificity phosphatase PhoE
MQPFVPETLEQKIGRALSILNEGLRPFIEKIIRAAHGERWVVVAHEAVGLQAKPTTNSIKDFDTRNLV